jgi:hypothetical protein
MLAAFLLAAAGAVPFPAAGTYAYAASLSGQPVGQWSVTVKRDDLSTEIDESSRASLLGMALSAKATMVLAPDLSPTTYDGNYGAPDQNMTVTVALTPTSATVAGTQIGTARTVSLQAGTHHFVVVEPGLVSGLFALPAQLLSWKDSSVTWLLPMMGATQPLAKSANAPPVRPAGVPAKDVALSLAGNVAATIWYDPASLVPDRIEVPSENAVLTRLR